VVPIPEGVERDDEEPQDDDFGKMGGSTRAPDTYRGENDCLGPDKSRFILRKGDHDDLRG
jgi:hypothetical protein